jgi:hypothetical protein
MVRGQPANYSKANDPFGLLAKCGDPRTLGYIGCPTVTSAGDVSRRPGGGYAVTMMLKIATGHAKVFGVFLVSISLLALVVLAIAIGVHAFLAGVGHYAPWEQIWAG